MYIVSRQCFTYLVNPSSCLYPLFLIFQYRNWLKKFEQKIDIDLQNHVKPGVKKTEELLQKGVGTPEKKGL